MQTFDGLPLQELSLAIATVQDQGALLELVERHLRPLLGFRAATLVVNQGTHHHRYLTAASELDVSAPKAWPNEGSPYAELLRQTGVQQLAKTDVGKLAKRDPNLGRLTVTSLPVVLGVPLCVGALPMGILLLHYPDSQHPELPAPLAVAAARLLAVAVANVLVQEQVEQLQRLLLAPNPTPSASPINREQLAKAVVDAFRQLLPFDASCLVAYDRAMTYDWYYLGDLPSAIAQDDAVQAYSPRLRPRPDLQTDASREAWLGQPVIGYHDRALLETIHQRNGYPILGAALRAGVQESVMVHLRLGDQPVGALYLYAFEAGHFAPYFPLFAHLEHLLEPVAVGVSNALAYEALQLADQEKALQLSVGRALMDGLDELHLFKSLAWELSQVIDWDLMVGTRLSDLNEHLCQFNDPASWESGPIKDKPSLREDASMDEVSFDRDLQAMKPLCAVDGVYMGAAFDEACARYPLIWWLKRLHGFESMLCLAVPLADGEVVSFVLFSRKRCALNVEPLALLQRLRPHIAMAWRNQIAYAEIMALKQQVEAEKLYLVEELKTDYNFDEIVGSSAALAKVFHAVDQVGPMETTVLILGETGTGKELIARALHHRSPRRERVLIKVNCAALPPQLIESELFGHEKGAFTGAHERRIGKFELANKGTIFLDEIGELPLELQGKLLRVLQEREIERLGGNKVIRVDVRVVAATNRVLADEVAAGRFRADLYYRLSVFPLALPPLRERPEDIPLLAEYFGQKFSRRMNRLYRGLNAECLPRLLAYAWPGNVRELENVIEHAVIVSGGRPLECALPVAGTPASPAVIPVPLHNGQAVSGGLHAERDSRERERIRAVLEQTHWRIRGAEGAAALLNTKPTTLEARMKRLGLR